MKMQPRMLKFGILVKLEILIKAEIETPGFSLLACRVGIRFPIVSI